MTTDVSIAKAASVTGQVFAISSSGKIRPLQAGDALYPGEKVVTARNAQVLIQLADGREIALEPSESMQLDADVMGTSQAEESAIQAESVAPGSLTAALAANTPLDELLDAEAPAAGQAGVASEGGHSFVEFQRIVESIGDSASAYRFAIGDRYLLADRAPADLAPQEADTTPPNGGAAPTVTIVEDANNDGFINRAELQGDVDIRVAFDGNLVDVGDTVRVDANGVIINVTVSAQDKANGYVDLGVPPAAHGSTLVVSATIVDPAGNSTLPGQDSAKVDTSNLQGLAVSIVEDANNDGFINRAELSGKIDIRLDLPAEAIAGDLLTVRVTGNATRSIVLTQADIDAHHVMIDVDAPANGTRIEVSAQVSDPAGNLSNTAGDSATLMIGDLAAPTVTITEDANGDGWLNAAELQGDVDVRVDLPDTARAGDSLLVMVNGVARAPVLLTAADIAAGHIDLAVASPGDGNTLTVTAQLRDPAGNLSPTGSDAVTVDTTVFTGLAIEIAEDRNNDGFISIAELQDNDIDVRVTLPAGAAVGDSLTVSGSGNVDQVITLTAAHLAAGHVDLKFNPTADNTDFVATARITDIAGNAAGPVSDSARLLLSEPGAPLVAITEDANNNGWISAAELNGDIDVSITLPGTARVGDSLLVSINGVAQAPHVLTLADINRGSIALAVANPGEGQSLEVTAQVRDPAGNLGKIGSDSAIVDTIPPNGGNAPTVTITEDADNNGYINAAELNGDVDVQIAFDPAKVDAGDIVIVSSGTITREITVTAADLTKGYVTTAFAAPPSGDSIVVSARIVDPAGNSTPPGSDSAIVDTDVPNKGDAPTVTIVEDANNDGFINRAEAQGTADVRIDFKPALVEVGDIVRVTDGSTTREIVIDAASKAAGHVLTDFPIPAPGNTLVVTATIVDPAGNSTLPGQDSAKVDTSNLQGLAVTIVEDANNDGFINRAELSGKVDIRLDLPAEAIAGDLLTVRVTGNATRSIVLTQADIDAHHVLIDVDAPANGTRIEVSAQVSDPAGNLSNTASDSATLMIGDLAAPTVTITEDANGDGWLNAAELQGDVDVRVDLPDTARAGDSLLVSVNGVARAPIVLTAADITTGYLDLSGIASPGDGNTLTVTAQLRDPAGNLSPSGSDAVTVDTTVFTGLAIEIAEDRNNDGFISIAELQDNDIDVRVTLPAGAAVGDSLTVSGSGNVDQVITLTAAHLAAGHVDLKFNPTADNTDFVATARITDIAGNAAGPVSDSARLLLSEPGAPIVAITEDANNNGWISAAELNGDIDVSITLPGTARVGDSLLVSINGVAQAPHVLTLADINRGSIALAVANPGEGQSLEVTAQVRDPAGNLGKMGSDSAIVDTIPPNGGNAPTVTITEDANNDGYINAAELNGDVDVQIAFDPAKVDAGDIVVVSSGTITREITVTSADLSRGYVTTAFAAPPSGDSIMVSARIVDPAGNSTPPGSDSAIVDTDVPNKGDAPTVTIVEDANNDGFINRAEAQGVADVRIDFKPALVEVGDIVRVTDGNTTREIVIDAASKAAGHVLTDFPIPAPGNTLVVTASIVDPAGNSTLPGQDSAKVDTSNLQGLAVSLVEDANNDGFINRAELSGKVDIRLDLPPEAIAGDLLTVRVTGNATRSIVLTQADIDAHHVMIDVDAPANGTRIEVSAQVSDPAGNLSNTASDSATLMIGDLAAPTVTITEDANGDGWLNAAELQGDVDVRVDLPDTARAGDSLLVMVNGVARAPIALTAADIAAGHVELAVASPGDGNTLTVTAQLRDPAGNLSPTGSDAVTVDTTVFTGLAIEIAEDRNNDGFISIAELQDNDIDVRVTLPAGAAVGDSLTVSGSGNVDQVITLTAAHLAAGHVDLKFNPTADNTDFVATARITDIAGNAAGPVSDSARLLLSEPGAPIVAITEDANNNGWISAAELNGDIDVSITLPGTARVGDSLLVTINGVAQAPHVLTLADINRGSIALAVANPGEGQEVSVSAQVRDPAGNLGKIGSDSAIVDTIPPNGGNAPTVTITEDANNDGYINAAELNGDVDVKIAFDPAKVDAGDIVVVSSGTITREITVTATDLSRGYVSTAFTAPPSGDSIMVSARIVDPAGNSTPPGSDSAIVDTDVPNKGDAPTVTIVEDANNDGFINRAEAQGTADVRIDFKPALVEVGDIVRVTDGSTTREIVIDAASKAAGHVLTDFPIPAPGNTLVVTATIVDPAGNSTLPGQDSAKVDTSNLQGLAVSIVEDANNDGFINRAELSGKVDIRLDLPPEAIAGDLLTVRVTGNATRSIVLTQADIDAHHVMIDVDAPANGTRIEVSAQVSDPAGNLSNTASDSATLMIGDLAAPTVTITEDANGDGWLNAAELQGDVDVRVDLPDTARAGDSLLVSVNGVARAPIVLTAADIAAGHVELAVASPGDGNTLTVTAQLRDPAGNLSPTGSDAVTVDSTVFTGLAIEIAEDRNNDGFISIAELQDNDIDVRVTLPAGAAVGDSLTVSGSGNVDQVITLTAAHLAAGHVDLKFNPTADNTDFVATARITDIAGNAAGPVSDSARLLLSEPGAPLVAITEDADNNGWISAAELSGDIDVSITLPGTARVGDSLLVSINGVAQAPHVLTLADINRGSIALAVANPGEGQSLEVTAQVRDPAGNLGKIGSDSAIVDTIPPNGGNAPTVTITEDADNNGYINAAELNGDVDVQIAFDPAKVDAGDIVIVSSGTITREITVTAADKANGYVSTAFPPQAHGTILTVEALIRDPAGNATPRGSDSAEFHTALIIDDLTVSVSEEGLAKGLPDSLGLPADTTDSAVVSGSLVVANGTPALSYTLLAPSEELCSNGVRIVWSGDGTEASPLVGRAGPLGPEVICAKVDAQGNYEIRLLQAVDHLDTAGEDIAALNFTVQASDGNQQHSATLTLNIEDDAPLARDQSFRVGDGDGADTNLMIVLDVSSSMNECACVKDLAGNDLSRLDLAKLAINDLLDRYDGLGDVMVRLVIFGNDGQAIGDRWLTVDEARAALTGISAGGEASNYDAALATASQAFADPGRIDTAQNLSYFFSDGEPTIDSSGHPFNYTGQFDPFLGDGIDQGEELAWQAFLAQHQIVSQAIGVGPRGVIYPDQLNPIAWNGSNGCDLDSNWIADFNEMACVFSNTVSGPTTLTGSLGGFGADGGHVASLSIGGYSFAYDAQSNTLTASGSSDSVTAYQFDPVARTLTLTTVHGETLCIGLCDGSFRYHVDETPVRGTHTDLQYTLVDGDGDSASGSLGFVGTGTPANVAPVTGIETSNNLLGIIGLETLDLIDLGTRTRFTALDANNDLMRVEIAYRALVNLGPYHLQASLALAAELGLNIEITNDPGLLGLVLPSSTLVITAADGGTIDNLALNELLGTVHYEQSLLDLSVLSATSITATDSHGLSSTASVGSLAEVSLIHSPDSDPRLVEGSDEADSLQAIAAGSRLYGHGGDDLLQGAEGGDLLRGGDGNDGLDGAAGIDLLIGGRGNDILIGGADSDVFRWEFGDQGTVAAPATDIILDFDASAAVGAGGDVIDLRDLLQGEYHDGSDLGNLEQYLQIEASGDRTLIRINPLGDGSAPTQQLILDGVDLSAGGLHAGTAQIIENLIQQGRLLVD